MSVWTCLGFDGWATFTPEWNAELAHPRVEIAERPSSLLRITRESGTHLWSVRDEAKDLWKVPGDRPSLTDQCAHTYLVPTTPPPDFELEAIDTPYHDLTVDRPYSI